MNARDFLFGAGGGGVQAPLAPPWVRPCIWRIEVFLKEHHEHFLIICCCTGMVYVLSIPIISNFAGEQPVANISSSQGCQIDIQIGSDWTLNGTNLGLFKISFSTFWLGELKKSRFVPFRASLTQFECQI